MRIFILTYNCVAIAKGKNNTLNISLTQAAFFKRALRLTPMTLAYIIRSYLDSSLAFLPPLGLEMTGWLERAISQLSNCVPASTWMTTIPSRYTICTLERVSPAITTN